MLSRRSLVCVASGSVALTNWILADEGICGLGWAGLGWAGLGWAGLGWLGWAGLGWAGQF